uniref:non-specific serine/threonine protein kinase n=1 Tax=Lates calcarifer TaxID=8187 RepID=A0A4W6CDP4_LATCA
METENYVAKLNEYSQRTRLALRYEDVGAIGPDHIKTFTVRAVLNDKVYPDGVGKNKKEAKQQAAKNALRGLLEEPAECTENAAEASSAPVLPQTGTININYICWLNEYGQKNKLIIRPVESSRLGPNYSSLCCRFVVGDKEYPAGYGKTKKEAKEEAAKLVYHEICGGKTTEDSGISSQQKEESSQNVSEICEKVQNVNIKPEDGSFTEMNFIGLVNHYCQKTRRTHTFIEVRSCGPPHNRQFFYKLVIDNKEYPEGEGKTVKEAKQSAAQLAWSALQEQSDWDIENMTLGNSQTLPLCFQITLRSVTSYEGTPVKLSSPASTPHLYIFNFVYVNLNRFTSEFDSIERLGKGAFGRVFKAKQKLLDKYYAIKIVRCKEKALREVGALSDLHHCNIVRYYTCWMEDTEYQWESTADSSSTSQSTSISPAQFLYIQMELCDLRTLRVWIDEKNTQNVKKSLRDFKRREDSLTIALQIVSGVEYIHSKMLIHRDLKPANIMFGRDGEVKIGDFGLVTAENDDDAENVMERSVYKGTPSYMAPEQKSRSIYDRKVDIFALGLIYFELLWNLPTGNERKVIWDDARNQKLPKGFSHNFPYENHIIKSTLCVKPEDRPEASKLKKGLEEVAHALQELKNMHRDSRTV